LPSPPFPPLPEGEGGENGEGINKGGIIKMQRKKYYEMIDSLTVIHGVVCLCLDGTLGKLNEKQKKNLSMTERHVWRIYELIGDLMNVKLKKVYKKLRG
jgi:hypothetical protein